MSQRRFTDKPSISPEEVRPLPDAHPAMTTSRTLFPSTVVDVTRDEPDRILVSGKNNRKLGATVEKGQFFGYQLYGLSLEERATCPQDCSMRGQCYGNGMQMARRHRIANPNIFFDRVEAELVDLMKSGKGVLLRLHVLGDFPSVDYVAFWKDLLDEHPKFAIYGYTHRKPEQEPGGDAIGTAIASVKEAHPDRFRIRWSSTTAGPDRAVVIDDGRNVKRNSGITCPAQTDATACCATCGLCWEPSFAEKTVHFLRHGPTSTKTAIERVNDASDLDDDEVYELQSRVEDIEKALKNDMWVPDEWGLTKTEISLLNVFLKRSLVTRHAAHTLLYGTEPGGGPDDKIFDVMIHRMREKLSPFGFEIRTRRGEGWALSPETFAVLDAMSRGLAPPMKGADLGSALARLDVRPVVPIPLPKKIVPAVLTLDRPEVRMVRVADLKIESAYQRDLTPKSVNLIRKIVAEWDWAKFKPPICAEQEDGTLVVIDGQNTSIAAATHPGIAAIPALIVSAASVEQRAQSFVSHNKDRIPMSPLSLFYGEVAGGSAAARRILEAVMKAGASIPKTMPRTGEADCGCVTGVTALRRIAKTRGYEHLERVVRIATLSGIAPIASTILYALDQLLSFDAFKDVATRPDEKIATAVQSIHDFERAAQRAGAEMGRNRYSAGAWLIRDRIAIDVAEDATREAAE